MKTSRICMTTWCGCALAAPLVPLLVGTDVALADMIEITGDAQHSLAGLGSFEGTIDYAFDQESTMGPTGTLLITLTNVNDDEHALYITGFIFNIASDDECAKAIFVSETTSFRNAPFQHAQQGNERFDAGAALRGQFMGGGNPEFGIGEGETVTFEFRVFAADASSLTAESFINGPFDFNFLVRFRGSGVDIVPAMMQQVPGPSVLALMACCIAFLYRRRRMAAGPSHR